MDMHSLEGPFFANLKYFLRLLNFIWEFSEDFGGAVGLGVFFLCRINLDLWRNSIWVAIYSGLGVSKTFVCL